VIDILILIDRHDESARLLAEVGGRQLQIRELSAAVPMLLKGSVHAEKMHFTYRQASFYSF
jgi:hypothetical protein